MSKRRTLLLAAVAAIVLAVTVAVALAGSYGKSSSRSSRSTTRSTGRNITTHSTTINDDPSSEPGKRLDIDLATGGGIRIRGQEANEVSVEYAKAAEDCPDADIQVHKTDTGVEVTSRYTTERNTHYCSMDIVIRVPKRYDIHIKSSGGAVEIIDVEGTIEGRTGGGELYLERLRGDLDLATGGGEIHVIDSKVDGSVRTGGGQAVLQNVTGDLKASSGSGPVIRRGKKSKTS